jgi:alkylation response protein AidB-like acyl-CoA dehydrogenase
MHFAFTEEQEQLRAALRDLLDARCSSAAVRHAMATPEGFDRQLWSELAEMGVPAMAIPERYGGLGAGFLELAVVLEEAGRRLLPSPLIGTAILATEAIVAAGDPERAEELLPAIAEGHAVAAVARRRSAAWPVATKTSVGWVIDGDLGPVLDAAAADVVILGARTDVGRQLFTVDKTAAGTVREPLPTMDQTVRLARIRLEQAPGRPLGPVGAADPVLARVDHLAATALALLAVGGADACLTTSVAYARQREQFGRPIGSFQAIQHMCADMLLETESARSAAHFAAWCAAAAPDDLDWASALAKSYAGDAYRHAAGQQIQIHGGIGFTWEHDAHLHLKRAATIDALYGSPTEQRARLWDQIVGRLGLDGLEIPA